MLNKTNNFGGLSFIILSLVIVVTLQSCNENDYNPKAVEYNPKAIEYNNKAVELMFKMEYDSALVLFNKAVEVDKNYYLPYSNMTRIYLDKKEFDKALLASDKVIETNPNLAEGWVFAGMLYDRKGDSLTAVKYYEKSIELFDERIENPRKNNDLYANKLNRAISLMLLGQESEGKEELKKLRAENPKEAMIDELLIINKWEFIYQIIGNE